MVTSRNEIALSDYAKLTVNGFVLLFFLLFLGHITHYVVLIYVYCILYIKMQGFGLIDI